jgi:hypothetical protein
MTSTWGSQGSSGTVSFHMVLRLPVSLDIVGSDLSANSVKKQGLGITNMGLRIIQVFPLYKIQKSLSDF